MRFRVASSNDDTDYFRLLRPYLILLKGISQIIDVVKTANNKMQQIDTKYPVAKYLIFFIVVELQTMSNHQWLGQISMKPP